MDDGENIKGQSACLGRVDVKGYTKATGGQGRYHGSCGTALADPGDGEGQDLIHSSQRGYGNFKALEGQRWVANQQHRAMCPLMNTLHIKDSHGMCHDNAWIASNVGQFMTPGQTDHVQHTA